MIFSRRTRRSDPFSFDLNSSFDDSSISDDIMRKIKIGWLDNFDGYYQVDEEIRNQCIKTLSALAHNISVVEEVRADG